MPTIDPHDVLEGAATWRGQGEPVALATVVATWGSSPRPRGSLLAVRRDGQFVGSVSGGCVEAKVIEAALEVLADGVPRSLSFGVADETAWSVGLACGGRIAIFVERLSPADGWFEALLAARRARQPVVRFTALADGASTLWREGEPTTAPRALAGRLALGTDDAHAIDDGATFVQPFNPPLRLVIVGAVHVAEALTTFARLTGYDVTIIDPREAFARRDLFPGATVLTGWPDELLPELALDRRCALVTLTHDPKIDDPALEAALRTDAFYLGALGSRKTHAARSARLRAKGFDPSALARLHGPVGLDLGGKSPAEIALSIIAELTLRLRRPPSRIAGILLAAGAARRMDGPNKLVELLHGTPLVRRAAQALLEANVSPVFVVLGHDAEAVRAALQGLDVEFIVNPAHERGLGASLAAGARAAARLPRLEGVLVALGDMPFVTSAHVATLLRAFEQRGDKSIVAPSFQGQRGHPVLWSARHLPGLAGLDGDVGAKELLASLPHELLQLEVGDDGVLRDVDTPHMLEAARART
jgi:xanthine dehydrogenase accessory factor